MALQRARVAQVRYTMTLKCHRVSQLGEKKCLKMLLGQGDRKRKLRNTILIILDYSFHQSQVEDLRTCAAQYLAEYMRGYSAVLWDSLLVPPSTLLLSSENSVSVFSPDCQLDLNSGK